MSACKTCSPDIHDVMVRVKLARLTLFREQGKEMKSKLKEIRISLDDGTK